MDDEKGGKKKLRQLILQLKHMDDSTRKKYIKECEFEAINPRNDGWSIEFYKEVLEAAKHV